MHCKHAHMHTCKEGRINVKLVKDLEDSFAWVSPLVADTDLIAPIESPKDASIQEIECVWKEVEKEQIEWSRAQEDGNKDGVDILEGNLYNLNELEQIDKGLGNSKDESAESYMKEEIVDLGRSLKSKEQETHWGGCVYNKHPTIVAIHKADAGHKSHCVVVLLEWIEIISILQCLALNDNNAPEHVCGKSIPYN